MCVVRCAGFGKETGDGCGVDVVWIPECLVGGSGWKAVGERMAVVAALEVSWLTPPLVLR